MRWLLFPLCSLILCSSVFGFDPATQDDSQALVRHFKKPEKPLPPFENGKFEPRQGETITLMGGTDMYRMQEHGYLEALLHMAFPKKNLRIRNIAWPADTVYRQQRPMFFYTEKGDSKEGSLPDQREKIEPGIFVLQFGKMESLEGQDALPEFVSAYERLVDSLSKYSNRIVLMMPRPFLDEGPASELADERNLKLGQYSDATRTLAAKRNLLFIKNQRWGESPPKKAVDWRGEQTSLIEMESIENAMWFMTGTQIYEKMPEYKPRLFGRWDRLFSQIIQKNKLWNQYYRPTNWAFLFGDRQHVPSSRDHRDANRRWFVEELEKLPPLIDLADQAIWEEAQR